MELGGVTKVVGKVLRENTLGETQQQHLKDNSHLSVCSLTKGSYSVGLRLRTAAQKYAAI